MSKPHRAWRYHKDYGARVFDFSNPANPTPEQLHAEGWRDNPALVGQNPWAPGDEQVQEKVNRFTLLNDEGKVPAEGVPDVSELEARVKRYQQTAEYNDAALRTKDDEIAELKKRYLEKKQELEDARAEAAKTRPPDRVQQKRGKTKADIPAANGDDPDL